MAKDVDLSSREWLDLVFEGKNKDFGAYEIRNDSAKRHNKSVLYTIIGIILVAALAFAYTSINTYLENKRLEEERLKQEKLAAQAELEEKEQEQEEIQQQEEKKEEVKKEEIQNSQKVTELKAVADKEVKEPPKMVEDILKDDRQVGTKDEDHGTDDITKPTIQDNQIAVTDPKPAEPDKPKEEPKPEPKATSDEVFHSAATMPSFPGGAGALNKYLSSHVKYPAAAQENNVQGKVVVQFVVEKDGRVGEVKVARGVSSDLDREAVRVVKSLPKFSPGKNANGDPVRVWYTVPVTFKLQGAN